jgi:dTDP-D-glucose 4,6-dehydratase
MRAIKQTGQFKRDLKREAKGLHRKVLQDDFVALVETLAPDRSLDLKYVHNALAGKALPIYGDGQQIRDWLYVTDHCSTIRRVLETGRVGEVYSIGGWNEKANLEVVLTLCAMLDELQPRADGRAYQEQIIYVKDRSGHDRRYAIDARKLEC